MSFVLGFFRTCPEQVSPQFLNLQPPVPLLLYLLIFHPPAPSLLLDICPTGPGISSYQKQHKSITSVFPPLAYREGGKNTINCSHLLCMIFFFSLSASVSPWLTSLWVRINHLRDAVGLVIKSGTESERLRVNVHGFTTTEKMNCCFSLVTDLDSFAVLSALNPSPTFPPHL